MVHHHTSTESQSDSQEQSTLPWLLRPYEGLYHGEESCKEKRCGCYYFTCSHTKGVTSKASSFQALTYHHQHSLVHLQTMLVADLDSMRPVSLFDALKGRLWGRTGMDRRDVRMMMDVEMCVLQLSPFLDVWATFACYVWCTMNMPTKSRVVIIWSGSSANSCGRSIIDHHHHASSTNTTKKNDAVRLDKASF